MNESTEHEEDDLFWDIKWFLFQHQLLLQRRLLDNGGELIMDDRYLTDFTMPWKGVSGEPPRWLVEETAEYYRQQKQTFTSTTIGNGNVRVVGDPAADRIQIWGAEGSITMLRSDLPELIRVLSSARSGPTSPDAIGTPDVSQRSVPGQNELAARDMRPNQPGYVSQAEKNERALKRALGIP